MNKRISINVDDDCLNEIVKSDLISIKDIMLFDLERRKNGSDQYGIFHKDKNKDIAEMRKHIKAFDLVLKYYSVPSK